MKDDPGRQAIGSFNPITTDDWTDMAYIGNTQELCQSIRDGDLSFVENWCRVHQDLIDQRDHTGRTPLHVAAQCSTPEVLKCLVGHGARIVARLVDGMTALHIAAARGNMEMVTILLEKSEKNEASEYEKEDERRAKKRSQLDKVETSDYLKGNESESDESSDEAMDDVSSDEDMTMTEGSFIKVKDKSSTGEEVLDNKEDKHEPDIYDIDVVAWDAAVSPLHLAILGGHTEVIDVLVSKFGADVLIPVKVQDAYSRGPKAAIMTLILAATLTGSKSYDVSKSLLSLGASSAQADMTHVSVVHYLAAQRNIRVLKACFEEDTSAAKSVLDHVKVDLSYWNPNAHTPLTTAIKRGDGNLVKFLLESGAKPVIDIDDFVPAFAEEREYSYRAYDEKEAIKTWKEKIEQPVLLAVENDLPDVVLKMIDLGVDINTLDYRARAAISKYEENNKSHLHGSSLLDAVNSKIQSIEEAVQSGPELPDPITLSSDESYLRDMTAGTYEHWYVSKCIETARNILKDWKECKAKKVKESSECRGRKEQVEALNAMKSRYINLRQQLSKRGAKSLDELYPHIGKEQEDETSDDPKKVKHFQPKASFNMSGSEEVYDGYLQLFQAAWDGDLARIKELTLGPWGPNRKHAPLRVATVDDKGFSPFAIAVYRQHPAAGKLILEIANAQFRGTEEAPKKRYAIADEGSEYDSEDADSDDLGLSAEIVDDIYTVDNVAELKKSVASRVSGVMVFFLPRKSLADCVKLPRCYPKDANFGAFLMSQRRLHLKTLGLQTRMNGLTVRCGGVCHLR